MRFPSWLVRWRAARFVPLSAEPLAARISSMIFFLCGMIRAWHP